MADRKYYVVCDYGCKFESMTKEQILTAIMQAVENGEIRDVDIGFVTTIKTVNGKRLKFFFGEQSEYEALTDAEKDDLLAIITNDTSKEALENAIAVLQKNYEALTESLADGSFEVAKAKNAKHATSAGSATNATNATKATNADKASKATVLSPTTQEKEVDFSQTVTPTIDLNLGFGKTYLLQVIIDETWQDNTLGIVQVLGHALCFVLSIPDRESLKARYQTEGGYAYADVVSTEANDGEQDFRFKASVIESGIDVKFQVKRSGDENWQTYGIPRSSLVPAKIKCYELI